MEFFHSMRFALLIVSVIFIGCSQNTESPPASEQTTFSGEIETNTIWTKEHTPYIVTGDIIIKRNATLTIQSDVEVRFEGFYSLIVQGILIADGTEGSQKLEQNPDGITSNILFTSNKSVPEMKDWKGIGFDNTNDDNSLLRYVTIQYADTGIFSLSSKPRSLDCIIRKNQNGITLSSLSPIINHCIITDNIHGIVIEPTSTIGHDTNIKKNMITSNEVGIITHIPYSLIEQNNIIDNLEYALINKRRGDVVYARYNWWGTTDTKRISKQIYDKEDDPKLGSVLYEPFLNSEIIDAGPR